MSQKQIFVFLLLLSISVFGINCRFIPADGRPNNPERPVKISGPLQPIEQHPDPIEFGSLDLRDAVRAFKQKFGAELEIREMTVEPDAVTISPYGSPDFTGEYRYQNGGVLEPAAADKRISPKPKVEKVGYEEPRGAVAAAEPVKRLSMVEHFRIDEIALARLPDVARIARKQIWIDGGEVKKIVIARNHSNWTATVAGKQSEIALRLRVTKELTTVFDQDIDYERRVNVNALDGDELRRRIERINEDFGGELKMLNITVSEHGVSFVARDPQKPEEFNTHEYSSDGRKAKPRAVADRDILRYVEDAQDKNPKVRSVEDLLFTPGDFDFGSLPQIAEKSLNELRLEKSRIIGISIHRGEYSGYDGGELKGEINIDGDNRRRSGFVRFDVNGQFLKIDKR